MRRDGLLNTSLGGLALDHDEYHGARQMTATPIQEYIVLFAMLNRHEIAVHEPQFQLVDGTFRNGNEAFLATFTKDTQIALFEIEVRKMQVDQFTDAQPTREEHLHDGFVALPFGFRQVDARLNTVHLIGREHLGQMLADGWRLQQLRGIAVDVAVGKQETIEGAHSAEDARLRRGPYAALVQCCREVLQVL